MSEISQYINLGIAGVALYLIYRFATDTVNKVLDKIQTAIDNNTAALNGIQTVINKCRKADPA